MTAAATCHWADTRTACCTAPTQPTARYPHSLLHGTHTACGVTLTPPKTGPCRTGNPTRRKNKEEPNDMKHFSMKTTMLVLSGMLLFACNNEDFLEKTEGGTPCDYICFGVSPDESAQTKANQQDGANAYTAGRLVLRAANSNDTLCVRTIISDGIQTAENKAVTRGTPVTTNAFHNNFHVLTVRDQETSFFMDEDVTNTNGNWTMDNTYYWPGKDHSLQFYAWAPKDAFTSTPASPENLTFEYTVPEEATEQQDLVVASIVHPGNYNQAVNLPFKHICTAIKFVVGDEMQPGSIVSVALKGIQNTGTYNMTSGWTNMSGLADYTQTLNKETTGNESVGAEITTTEGTFMMLPQTLPADASVEVVFHSNATNTDRILSAPIGGTEWPEGKTVTYKLSITPEYEFKLEDENKVLDAHFEIFKTNLIVSGVSDGQSWTITAPNFGEGTLNAVTIQAQSDMNTYSASQGFWTDRYLKQSGTNLVDDRSARGEQTYSGTGNGKFPIAIFVPENVGELTRDIVLTIQINGKNTNQTISFKQLSPRWFGNGNLGCERIEGTPAPWGFYWDEDYKLIYDLTNCNTDDRESIRIYVEWTKRIKEWSETPLLGWFIKLIFGNDIPDLSFVDMETSKIQSGWFTHTIADKITINLGKLQPDGIALSSTDGQKNTKEVYNYQGIQYANTMISRLEAIAGISKHEEGTGINPTYNASIACMKLNSWNIVPLEDNYLLRLTNEDANPNWYLPASGEVAGITDTEYPLDGDHWSSTAQNNNTNAYKYSADGATITLERRDSQLKVRAVRKKP